MFNATLGTIRNCITGDPKISGHRAHEKDLRLVFAADPVVKSTVVEDLFRK